MYRFIDLITVFWCASLAVLHLTPVLRNRWENAIRGNNRMHVVVGIFVIFLGIANVVLLFSGNL